MGGGGERVSREGETDKRKRETRRGKGLIVRRNASERVVETGRDIKRERETKGKETHWRKAKRKGRPFLQGWQGWKKTTLNVTQLLEKYGQLNFDPINVEEVSGMVKKRSKFVRPFPFPPAPPDKKKRNISGEMFFAFAFAFSFEFLFFGCPPGRQKVIVDRSESPSQH